MFYLNGEVMPVASCNSATKPAPVLGTPFGLAPALALPPAPAFPSPLPPPPLLASAPSPPSTPRLMVWASGATSPSAPATPSALDEAAAAPLVLPLVLLAVDWPAEVSRGRDDPLNLRGVGGVCVGGVFIT